MKAYVNLGSKWNFNYIYPSWSFAFQVVVQMSCIIYISLIKSADISFFLTFSTSLKSLVITLLDLKNAFGELHHNLIYKVLQYHHIPDPINELIRSLYTNFQTSIITEKFSTPFITVGRGVLQGDCLSPLLFNTVCPLISSYNTLNLNHSCSLAFGNLIKLVFRVIQFIGSSLQTTRLSLVAKKKKIKSYSIASRYGVNGPI